MGLPTTNGVWYLLVVHNYRALRVWQASRDLAVVTYSTTKGFPAEEMFGLTSQMRRSAVSIAANLAEGAGRRSPGEFRRYVHIASGSASEFETHVDIAERVGLLETDAAVQLRDRIGAIKRMPHGLLRTVTDQADG